MRLIDADELRDYWLYNGLNEKIYDTNDVLESIDEQPDVDPESLWPTAHWISVKDRLPNIFDEVLVYDTFSDTSISIAWRETTPRKNGIVNWYWNSQMSYPEDLTHVTHWMPLPEPPEVTHND